MNLSEGASREYLKFHDEYRDMVYKLSLMYSDCNEDVAHDATQHAFIQLYWAMSKGTNITNIQTYLHTIAKNYTLNCMKHPSNTYQQEEYSDCLEVEEMQVQSVEEQYIETVEKNQSHVMLQLILDELKVKNEIWYKVVMEVFYRGRSQTEVAKELKMNDTAMHAMIRRIRKWSKKHKLRFEESASKTSEEVSDGHLFSYDDESTSSS